LEKIHFIVVVGEKEVDENTLTVRELGSDNQVTMSIDDLIKKIKNSCRID